MTKSVLLEFRGVICELKVEQLKKNMLSNVLQVSTYFSEKNFERKLVFIF